MSFMRASVSLPYFAIESLEICWRRSWENMYVAPRKYLSRRARRRMIGIVLRAKAKRFMITQLSKVWSLRYVVVRLWSANFVDRSAEFHRCQHWSCPTHHRMDLQIRYG